MKHKHITLNSLVALAALFFSYESRATQAVLTDDTYSIKLKPTSNFGLSKTLPLKKDQNVYLRFSLGTLPAGTTGSQVTSATLRVWVDHVIKPGTFDVYEVASAWQEKTLKANALPTLGALEATGVALDATSQKQFLTLDVTALVKDWLSGMTPNNGIAFVAPVGSLLFATIPSKEDVATGHLAELEINTTGIYAPFTNTANTTQSSILAFNTGTGNALEGSNTSGTGSTSGVVGKAASNANGIGANGGVSGVLGMVTPTSPGGYSAGVRGVNRHQSIEISR